MTKISPSEGWIEYGHICHNNMNLLIVHDGKITFIFAFFGTFWVPIVTKSEYQKNTQINKFKETDSILHIIYLLWEMQIVTTTQYFILCYFVIFSRFVGTLEFG